MTGERKTLHATQEVGLLVLDFFVIFENGLTSGIGKTSLFCIMIIRHRLY